MKKKVAIKQQKSKESGQPSAKISPQKAKKMLKEGMAHGKPLTQKQKGMLGAAAGKEKTKKKR